MKFTAEGLAKAGMELVPPFIVEVYLDPSDDFNTDELVELQYVSVARVLPGRRVSGIAVCSAAGRGETVFAKLFYGKRARRYWHRELQGAARLQSSGVPTPKVLARGATADGGGFVVLFEALEGAANLDDESNEDMREAVRMLAGLHDADLIQTDVHVGNFVRAGEDVYVVDADGVQRATHVLRQQFPNLGMLLAQRTPLCDADIDEMWSLYSSKRGEYVTNLGSSEQLRRITDKQRTIRVRRFIDKTQRECTMIVHRKSFLRNWLCDRDHWPRLQRFMLFAETLVGEGTPLKLGNSSTVVRITVDDTRYIVKRFNVKNFGHRVRRWFKRRPRQSWQNGHKLAFLGIRTARPVALLEQRLGWFVSTCYLVMPDCGERDLGQALATEPGLFDELAPQVVELLAGLKAANLAHGDLKASNFVLDENRVTLIDFDAVRTGDNAGDIARFLRNWDEQPELRAAWQQAFEEARL